MSKPIKSHQFRPLGQNVKVDVGVWEGKEKEGKALPSNLSLRMQEEEKTIAAYFAPEDALAVSAILERYATDAVALDGQRRLEAWKVRNAAVAATA
ncbi:hypothetical protein HZC09_02615 [Candidatus Micrarchaeota archaeon]|nr:hypothetical protein [Candidatus Micrarchaeota archaeon]